MSDPLSDPDRLRALAQAGVAAPGREASLDRLTRLATRLLAVPVSLVSIVDDRRQYSRSAAGADRGEMPALESFCHHVVIAERALIVDDARQDPRVCDLPAVREHKVIAYAGVPLTTREGHTLGSFCAIDRAPRSWRSQDIELLEDLSRSVLSEIELRAANRELARRAAELVAAEGGARRQQAYSKAILRSMHEGLLVTRKGQIIEVNRAFCELTGYESERLVGARVPYPFWAPESLRELESHRRAVADGLAHELRTTYRRSDGTPLRVSMYTVLVRGEGAEGLGFVTTVRNITSQERHETELQHLANHDSLTGMPNRRAFQERLQAEIARAQRHGRRLSIAILDLDHFKQVNDRHGHAVGDRVLEETARRLLRVIRRDEHIARLGGEEFGWILPDSDLAGACAAADRARTAIADEPFGDAGRLTLSAGVCARSEASDDLDALYRGADQALYAAKHAGRDRTVAYEP
ncbi:MAG: diguanylate cyclase [Solirubrobacteraceae bacterium]